MVARERKFPGFSSIRVQLAFLVAIVLAPPVAVTLYTTSEQRQMSRRDGQQEALELAHDISQTHQRFEEGARQLLTGLARIPEVQRREPGACTALFQDISAQFPQYATVAAATPDGDFFCSGTPLTRRVNIADRAYFQRVLQTRDFVASGYLIGRLTGTPVSVFAYPAIDASGAVRAIVLVGLDLRWLNHVAAGLDLRPGGRIVIIDRDGIILTRFPDDEQFPGKPVKNRELLKTVLEQRNGVTEAPGVNGESRLYGFTTLMGTSREDNAFVWVSIPTAVAYADADRLLRRNLIALAFFGLAAIAVAWIGAHRFVVRPVDALASTAARLGAGDLTARVGVRSGPGELSRLGHAFNEMAASLQQAQLSVLASEKARREEEARYRTLFEQSPSGIVILDPETTLPIDFNGAAHNQLGYSREDFARLTLRDYQAEGSPAESPARLDELLRDGPQTFETAHRTKTGEVRNVLVSAAAFILDGRRVISLIRRDMTDYRRATESLHQSEKLSAMGELLAGVAHELNNPLSVVTGRATILREKLLGTPLLDGVDKLLHAANRCARIVRNFLALARERPPERTEVTLDSIAREALELVAYPLRVDNVEISVSVTPDLPVLWADPHQLHQVFVNLITNAHHAMRGLETPRRLSVAARFDPERRRFTIEVADTGPGVPPGLQSRIFEPFFTTKPVGQGTGLGLSLCKGIIEAHGGTIHIESAVPRGAVFVIELPTGAPTATGDASRAATSSLSIAGQRVLVVDDEPAVAEILAEMLAIDGAQVETATSVHAALERLSTAAWDVILSDIKMPGLDGFWFYQEIAMHHPALLTRLAFVTGDSLDRKTQAFLDATGTPTLAKPFTPQDIRRTLARVIGQRSAAAARGAGAES